MKKSRPKSTPDFKRAYDKKRAKIATSFNLEKDDERRMYAFAQSVTFSVWVKEKIAKELGIDTPSGGNNPASGG